MGFLDTLFGRTKPVQPKLDDLFALPSAAITLEAATGFTPTGSGSVCFRAVEGKTFSDVQNDVRELLNMDSGKPGGALPVEVTKDTYGYTWVISSHLSDEIQSLVTDLHAVNSALVDNGFGPQLLCTLVAFRDSAERRLGLVYLYKRGTFYPFAPLPGEKRDNALELEVKGVLGDDLKLEQDLTRWFPVWGAPGLWARWRKSPSYRAHKPGRIYPGDAFLPAWRGSRPPYPLAPDPRCRPPGDPDPGSVLAGMTSAGIQLQEIDDAATAADDVDDGSKSQMSVTDDVTQQGIILTEAAAAKVSALLNQEGRDDLRLRVAVQPGGCSGLRYQLYFDERDFDGDIVKEFGGVGVVTDKMSAPYLTGATIDFVDTIEKQGFTIDNPNASGSCACGDSFH